MITGIDVITSARKTQIGKGWTKKHDLDSHNSGELIKAAKYCLTLQKQYVQGWDFEDKFRIGDYNAMLIKKYGIAGAFLAAEIDRLLAQD